MVNVQPKMTFNWRPAALLLALLLCLVLVGSGSILTPGTNPTQPDLFSDWQCPGASCPIWVTNVITGPVTSSNGKIIFTMNAGVYKDPINTFCSGCLDFVYQVSNDPTSTDDINRLTAINFTGWQTDVGYLLPNGRALDVTPLGHGFVNGSARPGFADRLSADVVGFMFNEGAPKSFSLVSPGTTSLVLVIQTNATNYALGRVNVIDGSVSTVSAFQPQ